MNRIVSADDWPGTFAELQARVNAFAQAKIDHAKTEGVPAPREDDLIEQLAFIQDNGGTFTTADEAASVEVAAASARMSVAAPIGNRFLEYAKRGCDVETIAHALLTNDAAKLAELRAIKAVVDADLK